MVDRCQRLAVDRAGEGLPHVGVAQRPLRREQAQPEVQRRRRAEQHLTGVGVLQVRDDGRRHLVGAVELPAGERLRQARGVGREAEDDLVGVGGVVRVPVVVVAGQRQALPRLPGVELHRSGAHHPAVRRPQALPRGLGERLLHDGARERGQRVDHQVVGLGEPDGHLVVAGGLDGLDVGVEEADDRPGTAAVLQAPDHVVGRHGAAVPEGHVVAERVDQRLGVRLLERLGQQRLQGVVLVDPHQRLAHLHGHQRGAVERAVRRVDRRRLAVREPPVDGVDRPGRLAEEGLAGGLFDRSGLPVRSGVVGPTGDEGEGGGGAGGRRARGPCATPSEGAGHDVSLRGWAGGRDQDATGGRMVCQGVAAS